MWGSHCRALASPHRTAGFVTVELALALPLLVVISGALVTFLLTAGLQVLAIETARATARAALRCDELPQPVLPGATVSVERGPVEILVRVRRTIVAGPWGGSGLSWQVSSDIVALPEPGVAGTCHG